MTDFSNPSQAGDLAAVVDRLRGHEDASAPPGRHHVQICDDAVLPDERVVIGRIGGGGLMTMGEYL